MRHSTALWILSLIHTAAAAPDPPPNVLLLIADDLGIDRVAAYNRPGSPTRHPNPGRTENLDQLADRGVLFRHAYSNPTCSPTRATILTGRYAHRTGIGLELDYVLDPAGLDPGLPTLPSALRNDGFTCAALGKWHLSTVSAGGMTHPLLCGFDVHLGSPANLGTNNFPGGYFDWPKASNGTIGRSTTYATTDTVDDAILMTRSLPEPWFLWVAFNAPHTPFHAPPSHLHSFALSGSPDESPVEHVQAAIMAMDTEIGRLFSAMGSQLERTNVFFLGDNGTAGAATSEPFAARRAKHTVYQGGIHVPLIVAGPSVVSPGRTCDALVNTTDLYETIRELAGIDMKRVSRRGASNSISFAPHLRRPDMPTTRRVAFAEWFAPNGPGPHVVHERAIIGRIQRRHYKLIRRTGEGRDEEFFDLDADPFEHTNLPAEIRNPRQERAHRSLGRRMVEFSR